VISMLVVEPTQADASSANATTAENFMSAVDFPENDVD
jgi:hypothetical protein